MTDEKQSQIRAVLNIARAWEKTADGGVYAASIQVSLSEIDENGVGSGYRLAGPKLTGKQVPISEVEIDERGAAEIRRVLDAAFPPEPAVPSLPDTVYVVETTAAATHPAEGVYLSEAAAEAAAHVIAGEGATNARAGRVTYVSGPQDDVRALIFTKPLHTDDSPWHGLPEWLPADNTAPSLAWAAELDDDDQADLLDDVRKADTVADLRDALSTWWVIAMGERAHLAAPGPDAHNLPVVDQAAVTAALDTRSGGTAR